MSRSEELYNAILEGNAKRAHAATEVAIAAGVQPMDLISGSMVPAMDEVGRLFEAEEYFVPELLLAGRAMRSALDLLRPLMTASGEKLATRVVIGTVKGDLHDIGKNIVTFMLDINGFEVKDIGIDVSVKDFIAAINEFRPDVVGLSGFLTLAFDSMKETIEAIQNAGLRDKLKIMIGGGQVDETVRNYTGADAFGINAIDAVSLCKQWMGVAA